MKRLKLSATIPVYNSGEILLGTYENVKAGLGKITKDYEILFRNDGSTDNSQNVLEKIAKKDRRVKIFSNPNHGLGFVLRKLFKAASGDFVIYMDADAYLSFDLGVLPKLLDRMKNTDVVIAARYKMGKVPLYRLVSSMTYRLINRLLFDIDVDDTGSGFVVFRKKALDAVELSSNGFEIHIELLTKLKKAGFRVAEMPVEYTHWRHGSFRVLKHGPATLINTIKIWLRG